MALLSGHMQMVGKCLVLEDSYVLKLTNNLVDYNLKVGAYYNGQKFKYQPTSCTEWFSYKIWTKNSKTPMVNLLKNLRPFRNYIF